MKSYSQDLRDRIIQALTADDATQHAIATRFCVSLSFVEKLWRRFRRSGSSAAKPHAGGKQRHLKAHTDLLRHEVEQQPDQELRGCSHPLQGWQCELAALEDEAPLALPPGASLLKPFTFHQHIRHQT